MTSQLIISKLSEVFRTHRVASLSALGFSVVLPFAWHDYSVYLSYGPGGLPYNIVGWLVSTIGLRLASREQLSTHIYDDGSLPFADEPSRLPQHFPPQRTSPRPRLGPHPVPQRQLDQLPDEEVRQKLVALGYLSTKDLEGSSPVNLAAGQCDLLLDS